MQTLTQAEFLRWQDTLLEAFGALVGLFRAEGIEWFCCGGTAIGALRHGGFIPWDDDIDVFVPRPSYDRLASLPPTAMPSGYELLTPQRHADYPWAFAKFSSLNTTLVELAGQRVPLGLNIDVFPIDGAPDDTAQAVDMERRFCRLKHALEAVSTRSRLSRHLSLLASPHHWGRFARKSVALVARQPYRRRLLGQMDAISRAYDYETSKNVAVYCGSYGANEIFPREWLVGQPLEADFCGLKVRLAPGVRHYLTQQYGDYMQLPPPQQRMAHHQKRYFNLDARDDAAIRWYD